MRAMLLHVAPLLLACPSAVAAYVPSGGSSSISGGGGGPEESARRQTPTAAANNNAANHDWLEAELAVHPSNFPSRPAPDLQPDHVALSCLRSLQLVDHPHPGAGLDRIFPFLTWQCRSAVTGQGVADDTAAKFRVRGALSPILQVFMGATRIDLGQSTKTPGTATRGDIVSYPVRVRGATVHAFQHRSGIIRQGIRAEPPVTNMIVRLERSRRPPNDGCWMIKDIVDVRFAKGGMGWSRDEGV